MLADAAVLATGLELLAQKPNIGTDALAFAADAARRALQICQQVTGGLGFTLEFPLQRAYRRAGAAQAWADQALIAWERLS
jgi:alkylation response protein AidB-like acyl-CoA dehydrogenase